MVIFLSAAWLFREPIEQHRRQRPFSLGRKGVVRIYWTVYLLLSSFWNQFIGCLITRVMIHSSKVMVKLSNDDVSWFLEKLYR